MKNKVLASILAGVLTFSLMNSALAEQDDIVVTIDGSIVNFDVPPQIINDRTMVPMRAIFESLGASVDWDQNTRTITSNKDGTTISLTIGSPAIIINDTAKKLESAPCIVLDRAMVPVRAISEAFNMKVEWDGGARTVAITSSGNTVSDNIDKLKRLTNEVSERYKNLMGNSDKQKISDSKSRYLQYLAENKAFFLDLGYTEEEIEEFAINASGYDPSNTSYAIHYNELKNAIMSKSQYIDDNKAFYTLYNNFSEDVYMVTYSVEQDCVTMFLSSGIDTHAYTLLMMYGDGLAPMLYINVNYSWGDCYMMGIYPSGTHEFQLLSNTFSSDTAGLVDTTMNYMNALTKTFLEIDLNYLGISIAE